MNAMLCLKRKKKEEDKFTFLFSRVIFGRDRSKISKGDNAGCDLLKALRVIVTMSESPVQDEMASTTQDDPGQTETLAGVQAISNDSGSTPFQKFIKLVDILQENVPAQNTACKSAVDELKKIIMEHNSNGILSPGPVVSADLEESAVVELVKNIAAPSMSKNQKRQITEDGAEVSDSSTGTATDHQFLKNAFVKTLERDQSLDPFDWDYDIHMLAKATNKPLTHMIFAAVERLGIIAGINVEENTLSRYCSMIERGYRNSNPYHNRIHAADVVQATGHFLFKGPNTKFQSLERFALIVSAAVHDYDHPGVNNSYLVNTLDNLALAYNDRSPLENHHVASAFTVMNTDAKADITRNLSPEDKKRFRTIVINCVLATDMARSFEVIGSFSNLIMDDPAANIKWDEVEHVDLVMKMVLKIADVSHPARLFDSHYKWSVRCVEEFYKQGDLEKEREITPLGFMDREKDNLPKSQAGFITYVVVPMYKPMLAFCPEVVSPMMKNIEDNVTRWKEYADADQVLTINQRAVESLNGKNYDPKALYAPPLAKK